MISGSFSIGEDIEGYISSIPGLPNRITFRCAQPNNRKGAFDNPRLFYTVNPYNTAVNI